MSRPEERYRPQRRLATGGMGEVWVAEDTVLDREVALKLLKHEYADDPTFRARFHNEARHAAALSHPHVASVFDYGERAEGDGTAPRPFLVMELVPGRPLSALLKSGEPMPADRAADLVAQAADGIGAAHAAGVVHRDVKPGNLLVTPDGTVKVTDFGIARVADGAAITQTGQVIGTPHYISPEQAEGKPATAASDIYALGVVLYECLAGQRPFPGDTPIQVALAHLREDPPPLPGTVPEPLRRVVDRALAKRPEDRFASAAELASALRGQHLDVGASDTRVLTQHVSASVGAAAVPPPEQEQGRQRRRTLPPWWPWAAAAVAVLAVVLAVSQLTGGATPESPQAAGEQRSSGPEPVADERVRVLESDYVGRDAGEVKKELERLQLEVEEQKVPATSPDQVKDTVGAVSPTGLLPPGTVVTLSVWEEYDAPEATPPDEGDAAEPDQDEPDEPKSEDGPGKGDAGKGKPKKPNGKAKGKD